LSHLNLATPMTPLRFARARMVPVLLLLIGSPAWLPAQQKDAVPTRTVKVIYPGPNSFNENGYEGGSTVDVRYTFNACAGTVVIALGLRPKTLIPAAGYWYNGRLYPLAGELATIAPPVIPSVQISGNVYHAGAAAAIISASASDSDKAGCLAESLTNVISISRYLPRTPTREMVDQLLSSFTLPTQMTAPGPLRNRAIEEAIEKRLRSEAEQAEAERKKAEEDAHAVAEAQRKKAEAEEKQTEEDQEKWEEQLNRKRAERERAAEEVVAAEQANWEQQLAISREKRAQEVRQQEDLRRQQEQEAKDAAEVPRERVGATSSLQQSGSSQHDPAAAAALARTGLTLLPNEWYVCSVRVELRDELGSITYHYGPWEMPGGVFSGGVGVLFEHLESRHPGYRRDTGLSRCARHPSREAAQTRIESLMKPSEYAWSRDVRGGSTWEGLIPPPPPLGPGEVRGRIGFWREDKRLGPNGPWTCIVSNLVLDNNRGTSGFRDHNEELKMQSERLFTRQSHILNNSTSSRRQFIVPNSYKPWPVNSSDPIAAETFYREYIESNCGNSGGVVRVERVRI
jgi:hypothetical protein